MSLLSLQLSDKLRLFKSRSKILFSIKIVGLLFILVGAGIGLNFLFSRFELLDLNFNFLTVIVLFFFIILFFHALGSIITEFYLNQANSLYMTLPVTQNQIFISRIIALYIKEFVTNFILILPFMLWINFSSIFGGNYDVSVIYFITAPLFLVLFPLLTVIIASILSIPIMFFYSFIKNKPILKIITALVFLGLCLWGYFSFVATIAYTIDLSTETHIIMGRVNSLFNRIADRAFFLNYIVPMLNSARFFYIGIPILVGVILSLGIGLMFLVRPFYYSISQKVSAESVSKAKKGKYKNNTEFTSLLKKEFTTNFRNFNKIFSYFIFALLMPFFLVVYDRLIYSIVVTTMGDLLLPGAFLMTFIVFVMLTTIFSANSLSLEGNTLYIMKTMPVSPKRSILVKATFNAILSICAIIITVIACIIFRPDLFGNYLLNGTAAILVTLGSICFNLSLDVRKPVTHWLDTSEINKVSKNTAIALLIAVVFGIAIGVIHMLLSTELLQFGVWLIVIGIILSYVGLSMFYLYRSTKKFMRVEV